MDVLKQMQVDAFLSRVIVYESAVGLEMWGNLFKWPPLVLMLIPSIIQSYTAIYPQTQAVDIILKIVSVMFIGLGTIAKLWHQAKGYDTNIQKFKQTHDSLSNIINEIDLTIEVGRQTAQANNSIETVTIDPKAIEIIIAKFDTIRKNMPLVPKNIFEKYYGSNSIKDINTVNELLNYRERRLLPKSRYILSVNPQFNSYSMNV